MKIMKTKLKNKINDEHLADNLVIYIKRKFVSTFSTYSTRGDLEFMKKQRIQVYKYKIGRFGLKYLNLTSTN